MWPWLFYIYCWLSIVSKEWSSCCSIDFFYLEEFTGEETGKSSFLLDCAKFLYTLFLVSLWVGMGFAPWCPSTGCCVRILFGLWPISWRRKCYWSFLILITWSSILRLSTAWEFVRTSLRKTPFSTSSVCLCLNFSCSSEVRLLIEIGVFFPLDWIICSVRLFYSIISLVASDFPALKLC